MSRILVIYASHYGQTCVIANRVAQRLREDGHEVEVADAGGGWKKVPPPEDYDAVILGSRVETGRHSDDVVAYIRAHRASLLRPPTGFFSVSMAASAQGAGRDPAGYMMKLFAGLEWSPTEAASFAGALPYQKYGWFMRFVMKQVSKRAGRPTDTTKNHVFTDYGAVIGFSDRIADRLLERDAVMQA